MSRPKSSSLTNDLEREPIESIVVTIDGPAGAGKSSVARALAKRLGYEFLDTGAMYRCVTLAVLRAGIPTADVDAVAELTSNLRIELIGEQVLLDGRDVSSDIRSPEISQAIGMVADNRSVRRQLTRLQRDWSGGKRVVTEGRDQGSEVFPDSPCKIFLIATSEERARRRHAELAERGIELSYDEVFRQQLQRDAEDESRPVGALRRAEDASIISTDGRSLEQVVDSLEQLVRSRIDQP